MTLWSAFARLTSEQRRLLAEALVWLPLAAAVIRFRAFPNVLRFGTIPLGPRGPDKLGTILWAVQAAARRMPFRAMCFERGLTVQRMLRSRGQDARLHYGIAPGATLKAHVWVSLDGQIVEGAEQAPIFQEVGQWP